ncbi:MAG: pullulanase [Candidatus Cohnella colombiensis]|uniref:pullulanase n=1 Tax=Candidatus Cohnella colombiensis TaxID=3121368 RepID=A0AA95JG29_9BACL|nr:MAG: pullulanase [Cohnella sp.]
MIVFSKSKKWFAAFMAFILVVSSFGAFANHASADTPTKVVLVGNLQAALGHSEDWDPAANATEMTAIGNGTYTLTGTLPKGEYEYKVALNGTWDVSYGVGNYTKPNAVGNGGNIVLTLSEETEVTFYYNHNTHKVADSTYYTPIATGSLPRVAGSLQTVIGDSENWKPEVASNILTDTDFDNVYSVTVNVPIGSYEYKIVLGTTWDVAYPASNKVISLPQALPVTFTYNANTHDVAANFTIPADPGSPVPSGHIRIHYNGDTTNNGLWLWNDVATPSTGWSAGATPFPTNQTDSYGSFIDIQLAANAKKIGFLVVNRDTGAKEGGDKLIAISSPELKEVWIKQGSDEVYLYEPVTLPANTVRIHYARSDHNQSAYGIWLWGDVTSPSSNWPSGASAFGVDRIDSYGAYVDIPVISGAKEIGFLVVNRTLGDADKDGGNKSFKLIDRYKHIWIKQGDDKVYISPYGEQPVSLVSAEILTLSKISLSFTMTAGLVASDVKSGLSIKDSKGAPVTVNQVVIKDETTIEVTAALDLELTPLTVTYDGKTVSAATGWRMLDGLYAYDGDDLGATHNADGTATLRLWAPTATSVSVSVYDKDDSTKLVGTYPLLKEDQGVWTTDLELFIDDKAVDSAGYFYQYEVTNNGVMKRVLDPYAKSMAAFTVNTKGEVGVDGDAVGKAAIVDLRNTSPTGFDYAQIDGYEKREDAVIWEAHIRDFTSDPSINSDLNSRWGTYSAFIDKLDYIQSLGITHVQLLPVMAWYYGDETKMGVRELNYSAQDNEYNWGYDPHNYFSPDGAYSEDATDPTLRVEELKGLIDEIHKRGMGVILDVVYTHMAKKEFLNDIVPNYYAWQDSNGNFIGGFGNNLATNHKMAEKLMVDSVKYWFDEYKIDGMRWDMMGDATYEAVQKAYDTAEALNPNALFIGEGWRTFGGNVAEPALAGHGADQDWMDKTDSVGVFSDEIRNELKSGFGSEGEPRFITGGARNIQTILRNIKAQPSNVAEDDPGDIVPYIEAHDNLPLYDVIAQSIKKNPAVAANDLEIHQRVRLGNLMVLTSQGTAFLHAGQEYGRTKQWLGAGVPEQKYTELKDASNVSFGYFIHDSYDSSDAINKFDWAKATNSSLYPVNKVTKDYTTGLIELRKSTDAFRLGDRDLVNSNVTLIPSASINNSDLVIGYKNKATDGTGIYYVFVNADSQARTLTLSEDLTSGTVLVDNDEAGIVEVSTRSGFTLTANSITLNPLSAVIIKKDASAAQLTGLSPDSASYSLTIGSTHQTNVYQVFDDGARKKVTNQATYSSDNSSVASVSANGIVTAHRLGTVKITATYQGKSTTITVTVTKAPVKHYVQINYIRPDGNYTDWNLWVWNTGVKNDQINFEKVQNGIATVNIEVAANATSVGFVLRKGTDWDTAKQDIDYDRVIPLTPGVNFTKVNVNSMVGELDILPTIAGPVLDDGNITFLYRDDDLFAQGQMNTISKVELLVNGNTYEMAYDASKQWFSYTWRNVSVGSHEYSFRVTRAGSTITIPDPNNLTAGKSIVVYHHPSISIQSAVNPGAITSNESAVLSLTVTPSEPVAYREGYMNLSELGGPAKVKFDVSLMAQSISVKDNVTAGTKSIPITLVDVYGNKYMSTATVTVKSRTYSGSNVDFDWDEARIYFMLTDRFADGDPTNNANVDKTHLEAYHGGDFQGIIDNLDYLQELGINTLWISPIVDNIDFNVGASFSGKQYGYHGYWAKDFTQLDEHLGDLATFQELIDKAHDKGIKIMVDVVLNHTGYGLKPDDNRPGITQADKDRFAGMLRTDGVSADTDPVRGELADLPDFITEDADVRAQIIDWQTAWLQRAKTSRGDTIDYFRVDTVKHVEDTTWKAFKNALTTIDPGFKMVGEYFGATIDSNGGQLNSGQMDSLLDFGFKDQARNFANGSVDAVNAYLADRESKLSNMATMAQFLSSHDENGFLSDYVGGDKGKLKVAASLLITSKGQPVVYYGEELGNSGSNAGDMSKGQFSENRKDMPWDELTTEKALHDHYMKLLNIRAKYSKVYSKGDRTKVGGSDAEGFLAFNKHYGDKDVVTIISASSASKSVTIAVPFVASSKVTDEYSGTTYTVSSDGKVTVNLPGMDQGGTVILSGISNGAGGYVPPITQADLQVIGENSLKNGKDGKVTVQLDPGKQGLRLPLQAATTLGNQNLVIQGQQFSVTLPNALLKALQAMVPASSATGAMIQLETKLVSTTEAAERIGGMDAKGATLKAASNVYEFQLTIIDATGKSTTISTFEQPIVISFVLNDDANKELVGIYFLGEDGTLTYMGGTVSGNVLSAEVTHFSQYAALEYSKMFADVKQGHWASAAIQTLAAKHILNGISDTQYAPQNNVTRAEFAAMLVRALNVKPEGSTSFTDVNASKWYASYVATATKLGIVQGRSATQFAPNAYVSREEMAAMIIRTLEVKRGQSIPDTEQTANFSDLSKVSVWAVRFVNVAAELGLVQGGSTGAFAPKGLMTRAESAQVIYNLLKQ